MIVTLWENLLNPAGTERDLPWVELVKLLSRREVFWGDKEHPGWSPACFDPVQRAAANVRTVWCLTLDYDGGESIDATQGRVGAFAGGLIHTTRKHRPESPRFRIVLPLNRPVSGFEFGELWKRVAAVAGNVDKSTKDPSRFWFLPGCPPESEFIAREFEGPNLDVDFWLAKPDPEARQAPLPTPAKLAPQQDIERRASAYIAKMPPAIAGQNGHAATFEAAIMLARGFALSEEQTYRLLCEYNARCVPPWNEKELRHKAKGAVRSERLSLGFLLNDDREWAPKRYVMPPAPPDDPDYLPEPPDWMADAAPTEVQPAGTPSREPGDDTDQIQKEIAIGKSAIETFGIVELRALCEEVVQVCKTEGPKRGYTTGVEVLDKLINGLRHEHVTVFAAGTSWGKSSLGVMIADENLRLDVGTLVISVEDSRVMYGKRLLARRAGVNALRLRDNKCDESDIKKLEYAALTAQAVPFFMSGVGKTVEWCAQGIRAMCKDHGVKLVICDYLQRFTTAKHSQDRRNQVTYVASVLSDAIKESCAAGVLLSQLKRIEDREPSMDDVKESGDIENMAEHVLLGWRKKGGSPYHEGDTPPQKRFIKVPKNKDGPTMEDQIELKFNEVTASFATMRDTNGARPTFPHESNEWDGVGEDRY
jgi:replicative DNA helicase